MHRAKTQNNLRRIKPMIIALVVTDKTSKLVQKKRSIEGGRINIKSLKTQE